MMLYGENLVDCWRKTLLAYFSENFDEGECNKSCDVCLKGNENIFDEKNVTEIVSLIYEILLKSKK